jgi:hypothetical protein
VDVDCNPAVALPAPDAVGIRTAGIDVLTLDFTAERLEPDRYLRSDSTFVDCAGARPGVSRSNARNVNQALQPLDNTLRFDHRPFREFVAGARSIAPP